MRVEMSEQVLHRAIQRAMFMGDAEELGRLAPCGCCCYEHTFGRGCPAYQWGGCRGQGSDEERALVRSYQDWYCAERGVTEDQFYGLEPQDDVEGYARWYAEQFGMTRDQFFSARENP